MSEGYITEWRSNLVPPDDDVRTAIQEEAKSWLDINNSVTRLFSGRSTKVTCPICKQQWSDRLQIQSIADHGYCIACARVIHGQQPGTFVYREPTVAEVAETIGRGAGLYPIEGQVLFRAYEEALACSLDPGHGHWTTISVDPTRMVPRHLCGHCYSDSIYVISRTSRITGKTYTSFGCQLAGEIWKALA